MKLVFVFFILLITTLSLASQNDPQFWAKNSLEAEMSYEFYVLYQSDTEPTPEEAQAAATEQATYLFGSLAHSTLQGSPREIENINVLSVAPNDVTLADEAATEPSLWKITYQYHGIIQTQQTTAKTFAVALPFQPASAYEVGIRDDGSMPCTDATYTQYDHFWYFFNPTAWRCPLKEGVDYGYVSVKIKKKANTKLTYPEYSRLVHEGEIQMHLLFGMDNPTKSYNPHKSTDINAENYVVVRDTLIQLGFTNREWSPQELAKISTGETSFYVEELTKKTPKALLRVRMFFGDSANYEALGFKHILKDAIAHSSVMIYSGHSGLGEYLKIANLEIEESFKILAPKDRYQIFFFNGCSTYPYYAGQYFSLKKSDSDPQGTLNLDIITNGLATYFNVLESANIAVVKAVYLWAIKGIKTSYQQLILETDSDNLTAVNGDEDNK